MQTFNLGQRISIGLTQTEETQVITDQCQVDNTLARQVVEEQAAMVKQQKLDREEQARQLEDREQARRQRDRDASDTWSTSGIQIELFPRAPESASSFRAYFENKTQRELLTWVEVVTTKENVLNDPEVFKGVKLALDILTEGSYRPEHGHEQETADVISLSAFRF